MRNTIIVSILIIISIQNVFCQKFSPAINEKIETNHIKIKNEIDKKPYCFKTQNLKVCISSLSVWQREDKRFMGFFVLNISDEKNSEAEMFKTLNNSYESWYIGNMHTNFDCYIVKGKLNPKYHQGLIDGISTFVLNVQ